MADILKITAPMLSKQPIQHNKQAGDTPVSFSLHDIAKVAKSGGKSEMLNQNNTMLTKDTSPAIITDLLKDTGVTVSFLTSIFMLQEIIKLLPLNNNAVTQEIQQLFDQLLLNSQDITKEMLLQENATTIFKGGLFDYLRTMLGSSQSAEQKTAILAFAKSISGIFVKNDVLDSVANNLEFLAGQLEPSKTLHDQLTALAARLRQPDAGGEFSRLKGQVQQLLRQVQGSILFSPHMAKIIPIISYNLSRFVDGEEQFANAVNNLMDSITDPVQKEKLTDLVRGFLQDFSAAKEQGEPASKVMRVLTEIIAKQMQAEDLTTATGDKMEKIIYSLLSSPSNFTPLLHFILPLEHMDTRAFAEIWIDNNPPQQEEGQNGPLEEAIQMLIVFDIEEIGRFESDIMLKGGAITLSLLCPPEYLEDFVAFKDRVVRIMANSPYKFGGIEINPLERPRSLMEVFTSLPDKRVGVDVKV